MSSYPNTTSVVVILLSLPLTVIVIIFIAFIHCCVLKCDYVGWCIVGLYFIFGIFMFRNDKFQFNSICLPEMRK